MSVFSCAKSLTVVTFPTDDMEVKSQAIALVDRMANVENVFVQILNGLTQIVVSFAC